MIPTCRTHILLKLESTRDLYAVSGGVLYGLAAIAELYGSMSPFSIKQQFYIDIYTDVYLHAYSHQQMQFYNGYHLTATEFDLVTCCDIPIHFEQLSVHCIGIK